MFLTIVETAASKVSHLVRPIGNENIVWFQITMPDLSAMKVCHCLEYLLNDLSDYFALIF